jgi:hypothetical protein
MGRILRCVVAALTAFACEAWAQADAILQSLFAGLTRAGRSSPLAKGHRMKPLLALLAFVAVHAHAQGVLLPGQTVPIALQVQRLAPQLVAFAGSQGNFENLVNGLALGVPVTLTTVGADGVAQTATFALPGGAVSDPAEIARRLETARQQLIASGVATPSAQQLGELISGTTVPVTVGTIPTTPAAAGGTAPSPAQQIQSRSTPVAPQVNTSDSRLRGNTSDSPTPPASGIGATPTPPSSPALTQGAPSLPPARR